MADNSTIAWTEATWNPVSGCTKVSPGCDHCYAETFAERWRGTPGHYFENGFDLTLRPDKLTLPLSWRRPRRVFVNSMSDLFHQDVPTEYIAEVFAVMAIARRHTFQLLTKRHARMRSLLNSPDFRTEVQRAALQRAGDAAPSLVEPWWPLRNVWVGVSVEDQQWADIRVPALLDTVAAVRWLSCEPLLGPVDLSRWIYGRVWPSTSHGRGVGGQSFVSDPSPLGWVVVGGESGHGARLMDAAWARTIRDQTLVAGVPFFFKQTGSVLARQLGIPGKGEAVESLPAEFQVRQYPQVVASCV